MRPLRIELEGFSSYRQKEAVDLSDIEFFSISGPTGSGKSSLVDAMIFALYGRVPRLGGNAVAPAITTGADRARVRFDFEVDGVEHTAVRLAERTKTGASVKEARLERGEEVLADGAEEVTKEVASLLRLSFDEFTRTVVLPQGEFARFLTAKKAERQELLRSLLALGIYGEVRALARTRAGVAADRADRARARLEALEVPDEEAVASAEELLDTLEELGKAVTALEAELGERRERLQAHQGEVDRLDGALARLSSVEAPERLAELDGLVLAARARQEEAERSLDVARAAERSAIDALEALPTEEALDTRQRLLTRLGELEERAATIDVESARTSLEAVQRRLSRDAETLAAAEAELERVKKAHSAHALAATLAVGEACPVCEQPVTILPDGNEPAELAGPREEAERARQEVAQSTAEMEAAARTLTELETRETELQAQLMALRSELGSGPDAEEIEAARAGLLAARATRDRAVAERSEKEAAVAEAERLLEDLSERVRSLGRMLHAATRTIADLEPPLPESEDVLVQWKELLAWVDEAAERLEAERTAAMEKLERSRDSVDSLRRQLVESLDAARVPVVEPFPVQVATHTELARQRLDRYRETIEEAEKLEMELHSSRSAAAVAEQLAGYLGAAGFERWLMAGAISDLVTGANELLDQLSKGKYSLQADEGGAFSIVDHTKAGEARPVSTLSGGETFLFSLALAMSLAETLASAGGARLEAVILDEGFGTLDDEPLDIVASVLEELAAQDLVVGVITHVRDLAERAPARFEVVADPAGSRVVRVS
ncbi:MAG: SMC family ATPase [Actinobacteria bacterium]|nr:SMC family ATPase [Actinomycetota bacterium]